MMIGYVVSVAAIGIALQAVLPAVCTDGRYRLSCIRRQMHAGHLTVGRVSAA
jgi:hypothetical protein